MRQLKIFICCALLICFTSNVQAQGFLKKIKQKAEQTADKLADKKINEATGTENTNSTSTDGANSSAPGKTTRTRASNKGGEGLISTPPNVNENLDGAETAFKGGKYSDARYAIQQAMLGVEMEIGKKILAGLPAQIQGLEKDSTLDQVTSTGWGWAGLTIKREYFKEDQELRFTIANNSAYMQAINMYLANSGYMQTSGGEQKWKQIKVQDERAVIEYDQSSGYKLSIPIGQSSLLMYEGVNFKNEQEFLKAVDNINIANIKTQLGEK
jgi:hypothetical protein